MSSEQSPTGHPDIIEKEGSSEIIPRLSKSAQKRQAKAERFAQIKLEKRAREKDEKALKRKEREERIAAGEDVGPPESKKRRVTREGDGPIRPFDARIVIDLGFDEKMTEKEVGSLCSQLAYTYASHRRTRTPFTGLLFTSLSGRALKHLDGINDGSYRRWKGAEWWSDAIDGLWNPPVAPENQTQGSDIRGPTPTNTDVDTKPGSSSAELVISPNDKAKSCNRPAQSLSRTRAACSRESVVYLTADAEDELTELEEGETYIIGGLVDRNRYKNLCANKAKELGIRSARLPIGRYLADMPTRKVLTVNQVFDILVHWVTTRDWEQAMQKVMPKRKFLANGKKDKNTKHSFVENVEEKPATEDDHVPEPHSDDNVPTT